MKGKIFKISYIHNSNINNKPSNSPLAKKNPITPNNSKFTAQNPDPKFKIQIFLKCKGFQILHN